MPSWLPSLPYKAPERPGYWHPVTSTLNWCEEDYYATHYIAEIVNTFTNFLFVWLAAKGARMCIKHGHDRIFLIAYIGYFMVGWGSFWFHATLKYPLQLVDELSMIYTTCLMVYGSFGYSRSETFKTILAISLIGLAAFITLYYHYLQDPAFHQNAYAILTAIVLVRSMFIMEFALRPSLRGSAAHSKAGNSDAEQRRENARDHTILIKMWQLVGFGLTIFLSGFGVWNLDNIFCSSLRRWRHEWGLPWGILSEGHGWWHLMTGIGAYCYIVWGIWLRHCLNGRQDEYELYWPKIWILPEIRRASQVESNGQAKKAK
ncbi:putative alkaline ceramidase [Phaeomoniella chlamydospora]|uniref:Putative alkaline ceramidase n=1 Tax=Phaeomoniella chlamydospora TaxID=158046 RepID=A0A0G2EZW2_PHACM|nr:putative alkaline ceramidase [Phaeomoniella chlamydospora]